MAELLQTCTIYLIELCSGEQVCWRYLGPDSGARIWWQDVETGRRFEETSLMYAWHIVERVANGPGELKPAIETRGKDGV
jgi:hypothetical protein